MQHSKSKRNTFQFPQIPREWPRSEHISTARPPAPAPAPAQHQQQEASRSMSASAFKEDFEQLTFAQSKTRQPRHQQQMISTMNPMLAASNSSDVERFSAADSSLHKVLKSRTPGKNLESSDRRAASKKKDRTGRKKQKDDRFLLCCVMLLCIISIGAGLFAVYFFLEERCDVALSKMFRSKAESSAV